VWCFAFIVLRWHFALLHVTFDIGIGVEIGMGALEFSRMGIHFYYGWCLIRFIITRIVLERQREKEGKIRNVNRH
jgi:hypothetical protein